MILKILQDYFVYCSVQDSAEDVYTNHNDKTSVAVWGKSGKIKVIKIILKVVKYKLAVI